MTGKTCVSHPHPHPHFPPHHVYSYSAVTEGHGEVEIRKHPNCSHCPFKDCQWQAELWTAECTCPEGTELAVDNVTCMGMSS